MKRLALLLPALCLAQPNPRVGFYQWAGSTAGAGSGDLLTRARERIRPTGAGLLRFYLGARFDYVHPVLSPRRFAELRQPTPAAILQLPRYRAALEDPLLPTLVLTTYPSIDYGAGPDDINLLRPWTGREEKQEYSQMFELAEFLLRRYGTLDKTIVLSNAEADDKLLEVMNYTGSPELAMLNLEAWQNTRFRAVEDARRKNPKSRLKLLIAFEISLVNLKIRRLGDRFIRHPEGRWNALGNLVPRVRFDLLSYSSYESTNSPYETGLINTPAEQVGVRLRRDLNLLRKAVPTPIMIGELGFARELFDGLPGGGISERLASAQAAIEQARPALVVFWQVFDAPPEGRDPVQFGLLDPRRPAQAGLVRFISSFR